MFLKVTIGLSRSVAVGLSRLATGGFNLLAAAWKKLSQNSRRFLVWTAVAAAAAFLIGVPAALLIGMVFLLATYRRTSEKNQGG